MKRGSQAGSSQALAQAFQLMQGGKLEAAEAILRSLLIRAPRMPAAHHLLGLVRAQRGDLAEALSLLGRAVELAPNDADAWRNLGNLCVESGAAERAEACFRRVIDLAPGDVPARGNLALLLERSDRVDEAIDELYALVRVAPADEAGLRLLAKVLRQSRRHEEEVAVARELVRLRPSDAGRARALSRSYFLWFDAVDRDPEAARRVLAAWLAFDDADPVARHMAAAHALRETPARAEDGYVTRHFDEFAETFDEILHGLAYRGPQLVEEALRAAEPQPAAAHEIADIGCGTGLCAAILRPYARRLVGVDLSPKMLARARQRGSYDELVEQELTAFLTARPAAFDLVTCVDTLIYFGDLGPLLHAVARSLRPGGRFVATAERHEDAGTPFRLGIAGRYAHEPGYLTRTLEAAGLVVERTITGDLRREHDGLVPATVVTARR